MCRNERSPNHYDEWKKLAADEAAANVSRVTSRDEDRLTWLGSTDRAPWDDALQPWGVVRRGPCARSCLVLVRRGPGV